MTAGARYSRDDAEVLTLLEKLRLLFRSGGPGGGIVGAFPFLMKIAPVLSGYAKMLATVSDLQEFFKKTIREHKKTMDENNARDLIDVYLKETKLQSNNPDSTFTGYTTQKLYCQN
uniref:Cytochrome P450 n=1 Tax=Coptotermes formosanus TaxID=36987 RepID=R4UWH5_COPFO|nr:cytochrome P450 [Coptotermes formosanus]